MPRRGLFLLAVLVLAIAPLASGSALKKPPPRPPTKLHAKAKSRTSLQLSWQASADKTRVTGYYVYRSGKRVASVKKATTSYTFKSLRCGTSYVVGVAAHDVKGTTSKRPTVRGRTALCLEQVDTQAPRAPSALRVTDATTSALTLAWDAATDNVGVAGYHVYLNDSRVAITSETAYTFASLSCGSRYDLAVEAFDAAGNLSTRATLQASTAACPDTQAPTVPTNLRVTASTASSLTVTWDASSDNVGVTGYSVYLTGVRVATATGTSYTLTGLSCVTAYAVGVAAFDAAGNSSGPAMVAGTTAVCPPPPDTTAPSEPTELHVAMSSPSSLTLAWTAATDNVGVSGYRVYQDGVLFGTTSATEFMLAGLSCATSYTVGVEAVDAADNVSTRATITGTTPPCRSGGTLHVDENTDVDYTDPSLSYYVPAWQLMYSTGLQLYTYPDKPAPEGSALVPEAAVGFPELSDGGKTYTITVAPDQKFSDGTPVTADNFAYAINRALNPQMASQVAPFMDGTLGAGIVGARDVENGTATTASGVQVDGNKLIIKLERPSGDFLARLALPPFQAIKTDMAIDPRGVSVYPSAGPYHITARVPGASITLERNQYYTGTRPANADRIEYTIGNSLDVMLQRVLNGDTDFPDGLPAAAWYSLAQTYGVNRPDGQFHVYPELEVDYIALNTSRAPFNNVNLRKAVNYAIDRSALLLQRGDYAGTVTDQALPPGMAGYRDAQIYPLDRPDYATARALAGNSCGSIKVWASTSSLARNQASIVENNLEQIGCTVNLVFLPRAQQFGMAKIRGADYDATIEAWGADYPDPSDFINTFFDGSTIGPSGNNNYAYFDNPDINAKIAAAGQLSGAARYAAYGDLDVEIMTDHAPIVPLFNRSNRFFNSARVRGFVYQPALQIVDLNTFFIK